MPRGRPPKITAELVERIAKAIRTGSYKETASALVDVHRDTLNEWLRRGAKEKERVKSALAKGVKRVRVHAGERVYVELSDAVEKAMAEADERDLGHVDAGATGGQPIEIVTVRTRVQPVLDSNGKPVLDEEKKPLVVVERITEKRTTATAPDWHAAAWKLERRNPRLYGRRTYAEVTGRDGQDLIPLTAIRAALASNDEIEDAEWEELEEHAADAYNESAAAGLLGAGELEADADPSRPAPDLPE